MQVSPDVKEKVAALFARGTPTLAECLGITISTISLSEITGSMPVDERTKQPFGILHGGASVALAETLASIGAWLNVDESRFDAVGIEINANHIRPVSSGIVIGSATPIHRGRSTQVWDIRIRTEDGALVSVSRCTLAVVPKRGAS